MNNKAEMYQRIRQHGENLKRIFSLPADTDPAKLCKRLFKLENQARPIMVAYCNGTANEPDVDNYVDNRLWPALRKTLGEKADTLIFINHDPRGYTLKLTEKASFVETGIYKDWGGYGIIAPDLRD